MHIKWVATWGAGALGAHLMLLYLASTLGDVDRDIGWREGVGAAVTTGALVLVARVLVGNAAGADKLAFVSIAAAAVGAAVMVAVYFLPIFLMPPLKPGP